MARLKIPCGVLLAEKISKLISSPKILPIVLAATASGPLSDERGVERSY